MRILKAPLKQPKCHATVEMHNVSGFLFRKQSRQYATTAYFGSPKRKKEIFVKKAPHSTHTTEYYRGIQHEQIFPAY